MAAVGNVCGQFSAGGNTSAGIAGAAYSGRTGRILEKRFRITVADRSWIFPWGVTGIVPGSSQLSAQDRRRGITALHGILQGSTGGGICGAFVDLVGLIPVGGGNLFSGGVSEYLFKYSGRIKERRQRTAGDGGGLPASLSHPLLLHLSTCSETFFAQCFSAVSGNVLEVRRGSGGDRHTRTFHRRSIVSGKNISGYGGSVCLDGSDHSAECWF